MVSGAPSLFDLLGSEAKVSVSVAGVADFSVTIRVTISKPSMSSEVIFSFVLLLVVGSCIVVKFLIIAN